MTSAYESLAEALRERITVIGDRALRERDPAGHLAKLKAASENILRLQMQLPSDVDPQLLHFLERCSYDKALARIENSHGLK